jgi:hypothetical protein
MRQCEAAAEAAGPPACGEEEVVGGPRGDDGMCVPGVGGEWCSVCETDEGCAALTVGAGGGDGGASGADVTGGLGSSPPATCASGLPLEPFDTHLGVQCEIIGLATLEASCTVQGGWDDTSGAQGQGGCDLFVNLVEAAAVVVCRVSDSARARTAAEML